MISPVDKIDCAGVFNSLLSWIEIDGTISTVIDIGAVKFNAFACISKGLL